MSARLFARKYRDRLFAVRREFWCYIGVLAFFLLGLRRAVLLAVFAALVGAYVFTSRPERSGAAASSA